MSINKVILVGHVGKDPEVRHLESNVSVANFPLATSESYTNKSGEKVTQTEWHNIVCWRGLATVVEKYVKKGSQLYIEGRIRTRNYEQDGVKKYITEIYADEMQMLDKKDSGGSTDYRTTSSEGNKENSGNINESQNLASSEVDDLPF